MYNEMNEKKINPLTWVAAGALAILSLTLIIWGISAGISVYNVWSSAKAGEAQLAQANYNRQIAVREADAKAAAATELAKAGE